MKTEKQVIEMKRKVDKEIRNTILERYEQYQKEFDAAFNEAAETVNSISAMKAKAKIDALKELAAEFGYNWKADIAGGPRFISLNVIKLPTNTVKGLLK